MIKLFVIRLFFIIVIIIFIIIKPSMVHSLVIHICDTIDASDCTVKKQMLLVLIEFVVRDNICCV
jgi:hypothetical protein